MKTPVECIQIPLHVAESLVESISHVSARIHELQMLKLQLQEALAEASAALTGVGEKDTVVRHLDEVLRRSEKLS